MASHSPRKENGRRAVPEEFSELAERLDALSEQVRHLSEELQWLRAERIAARIDAGGETLIPLSVLERVIEEDVPPLKAVREWRGLSQAQLAQRAGTTKSYISQLETRHRSPGRKLLHRLAQALDVPSEVLLD